MLPRNNNSANLSLEFASNVGPKTIYLLKDVENVITTLCD
jgi:hypothetical protein